MKNTATEILNPLPGVTIHADRARRRVSVRVRPGPAAHGPLRELLYRVLNAYEKRFTVSIAGVPFCFLPDAADHITAQPGTGAGGRLNICRDCRLRHACPGPGGPFFRRPDAGLRPVLAVPSEIVFEVNRKCNLACRVCSSRHLQEELSLPRVKRELARARRLGIKNVRFTGGEPFLPPRLLEMLSAARKNGFYVLVNTNATLLTPSLIKKAAPLMDNVLVSLQGWDAASDAAETGAAGLFAAKLRNIKALRRAVTTLRLGTVISAALPGVLDKYLGLAAGLQADIWELYRPMAGASPGRGREVTPALLRGLADRLETAAGTKPQVLFANPAPLCLFPARQAPLFLGARFDDGHTRLVLDPRGFYKPSYYIQKDLGRDLMAAWNSPWLKKLDKAGYAQGCRACVFRLRCLGGSRFLAGADGARRGGRDPWLRSGLTARK